MNMRKYNPQTGYTTSEEAAKMMFEATRASRIKPIARVRKFNEIGRDSDGDGFMDLVDCQPNNPKKDGPISWIMAKAQGRSHDEVDSERKEVRQVEAQERQEYQKEMVQAKYQERREKFAAEKEARIAKIKEKYRVKTPEEKIAEVNERKARFEAKTTALKTRAKGFANYMGNIAARQQAAQQPTTKKLKTKKTVSTPVGLFGGESLGFVKDPLANIMGGNQTPKISKARKVKRRKQKVKIVYRYKKPKKVRYTWVRKRV